MKDVLIVCYGMGCGGAEKSLISFLNRLPKNRWNVDLIVANPNGMYMKQIPSTVHFLNNQYELENFATPMSLRRKKVCNGRDLINQASWQIKSRFLCKNLSWNEKRWELWGKHLPKLKKRYDLAISYMNGPTNYYVIDKVTAKKKILWIHNEFEKLDVNYDYERNYYEKADRVVTISQDCVDSFARVYPELRNKVVVLENISSANDIFEKAKEVPETDAFFNFEGRRIVSVGRLSEQKNFQLAVQAAQKLKSYGVNFIWYILGEGELRQNLTEKIKEYDLTDQVKLVGIKPNPYPYIANCDVFVQSSIYEGKSIVLDEAKILCKPIVITNYVTAPNSIESGKNGLIVGMTSDELARGVASYFENEELRKQVVEQLRNEQNSNDAEIEKYIALFTELMESNV